MLPAAKPPRRRGRPEKTVPMIVNHLLWPRCAPPGPWGEPELVPLRAPGGPETLRPFVFVVNTTASGLATVWPGTLQWARIERQQIRRGVTIIPPAGRLRFHRRVERPNCFFPGVNAKKKTTNRRIIQPCGDAPPAGSAPETAAPRPLSSSQRAKEFATAEVCTTAGRGGRTPQVFAAKPRGDGCPRQFSAALCLRNDLI